jgi:hypothetical protein
MTKNVLYCIVPQKGAMRERIGSGTSRVSLVPSQQMHHPRAYTIPGKCASVSLTVSRGKSRLAALRFDRDVSICPRESSRILSGCVNGLTDVEPVQHGTLPRRWRDDAYGCGTGIESVPRRHRSVDPSIMPMDGRGGLLEGWPQTVTSERMRHGSTNRGTDG